MKSFPAKKSCFFGIAVIVAILCSIVYSHCQIPCGIYDDPARFDEIAEHITTIEKSMKQVTELSQQKEKNMNQIIRWVYNKEVHADKLSEIVTYYFMAQRVKPVDESDEQHYKDYVEKVTLLHKMVFYSMKSKQTTDLSNVEKLRELLQDFRKAYFKAHGHEH